MRKKSNPPSGQYGGVIVEACIWLATLATLIPALTDIFFISNTYLSLNQVVREAVLTQITYPQSLVDTGNVYDITTTDAVPPSRAAEQIELNNCTVGSGYRNIASFSDDCAHKFIKWRIRRLLESHEPRIKPENLTIGTKLTNDGIMTVTLEATYNAYSFFFQGKRLRYSVNARYIGSS